MDAKELEQAIKIIDRWWCHGVAETFDQHDRARIKLLCEAARAHLSTLPREVKVYAWARVDERGQIIHTWHSAGGDFAYPAPLSQAVHLTGTAVLPAVKP